jgi:GT2 family glycosyltransferase
MPGSGDAARHDDTSQEGGLPSVSVIVPTYRYADKLEVTVRALLADPGATEVVVVIDGCRDGTLELLEALREEDSRVVPMFVDHVGKSGALSAALERTIGDVVLLIDQDVVADPGLVSGHAAHYRNGEHIVVLGYMPTLTEGSDSEFAMLTELYAREYEAHLQDFDRQPELVLQRLWGGNVSLRRDDCIRVGLDFRYFGHEDQDFGLRCLKAGLTGRFDRTLRAEHHHSRDAAEFLWYSKMQGASSWQIHQQHGEVVGPFDPDSTLQGLPSGIRQFTELVATPRLGDPTAALLATLGDVFARAGWKRGESFSYKLARRVELRTGAILAMAGREADLQRRATLLWPGLRPRASR